MCYFKSRIIFITPKSFKYKCTCVTQNWSLYR